jgi:hypothetical protein
LKIVNLSIVTYTLSEWERGSKIHKNGIERSATIALIVVQEIDQRFLNAL